MIGNRNISGKLLLTGADIIQELGFIPSRIEIESNMMKGYWNEDILDGGFVFDHCAGTLSGNITIGRPTLQRGTTSAKEVKHSAVQGFFAAAATTVVVVAGAEKAFTATTHDVAAGKYAAFLLSAVTAGTVTITIGTAKSTRDAALAALASLPALSIPLGIVIVPGGTAGFDATTDDIPSTAEYLSTGGILSGGVSRYGLVSGETFRGFKLGANANLNVAGQVAYFKAYRD